MRTYIDRLRKKSGGEQSRAAFIAASLITAVIVAVWSFTLPARLASTVPGSASAIESGPVNDLVESTKSDLENIVKTAEVWKGAPPSGVGTETDRAPGTSTQPESPRKVLIITSSSTKTDEKSE